jgi:hypothetical protein
VMCGGTIEPAITICPSKHNNCKDNPPECCQNLAANYNGPQCTSSTVKRATRWTQAKQRLKWDAPNQPIKSNAIYKEHLLTSRSIQPSPPMQNCSCIYGSSSVASDAASWEDASARAWAAIVVALHYHFWPDATIKTCLLFLLQNALYKFSSNLIHCNPTFIHNIFGIFLQQK